MHKETREMLESLKTTDVYSLILFTLFQLKDLPDYATLSELIYLMDKDSLIHLMEYYGGKTIRIPTIKEFKLVLNSLLLYEFVNLENKEFDKAFKDLDKEFQTQETKDCYFKVIDILSKFNFKRS